MHPLFRIAPVAALVSIALSGSPDAGAAAAASLLADGPSSAMPRAEAGIRGTMPFDCGDLAYDDGTAEDSIFFGGGQAGETDHFLGVRFELADFDLVPGSAALTGFCISNSLDFSAFGGPWSNEVFVYRDVDGIPQLGDPIRRATVSTGDGTGQVVVEFDAPWMIDEPVFWIMTQGDPIHAGEDFNMESDQSSKAAGRSWIADRGIEFMVPTEQNFMIRASVLRLPGNVTPVPALGVPGIALLIVLMLGLAVRARRRVDARSG
ncbi:hypothetical protein HFP89_03660 [Wenzhouxiangella sp. XN79A]|uniref:hypothetical protein n=1 Tax=Wenzhouxiangella sp. XN79A TaxID=2724193 RepID=UPI00144A5169|nr:hypothetical protein [Wenzhouxiangella sp. XN79A]NKI34255.1 hypothetical protein [Wenzhouxiangella sp. XN79A]